jgi:hypothetical protein
LEQELDKTASTGTRDDGWARLCQDFTDQELEARLFDYIWLAAHSQNRYASRIARLIAEAEGRGKSEMIERVRVKVSGAR